MTYRSLALAIGASVALLQGISDSHACSGGPFAGSYIGGHIGLARLTAEQTSPDDPTAKDDNLDFALGIHSGYNFQCDNVVLGIESDTNWVGLRTANTAAWGNPITLTSKVDWYSTLRARAGVTIDRDLLAFVTGGLAYAQVSHKLSDPIGPPGFGAFEQTNKDWQFGWVIGGGLERLIGHNLAIRAEAMYIDLGDESHTYVANTACGVTCTDTAKWSDSFWTARVGVTYRFGEEREPHRPLK